MNRTKLALLFVAVLGSVSAPAHAEPTTPGALGSGFPQVFRLFQLSDPNNPACVYYNQVAAGRGAAADASNCKSDAPHWFRRDTLPDSVLFQLDDFPDKCLIGDASTSPGVVIVGSCDDPRAGWVGGGSTNPPRWAFAPSSAPRMYLRDNGIALVLQNTKAPLQTPGYYWNPQ
ncbi:hypothetical protein [Nocardia sp. CS682]|uniref:hypothetical protein n=1 Tax=Nocardia sp. CS682 TaxID=1047172 RepID=UPI0010757204|nr:hypothetical protein [Nocardia sp. CS682]QBS38822.1 hypothetical protein DMB37_00510 [Nocardia sp. CS682]